MPQVIQLQNPYAFGVKEVEELLRRAVEKAPYMAPEGLESIAPELVELIMNPLYVFLLGYEDGQPKGFVMVRFPAGKMFPLPVVNMFYNEGSGDLRRALSDAALNTILQRGYGKARIVNMTGRSDKVWARGIAPKNTTFRRLGTILEVEVG